MERSRRIFAQSEYNLFHPAFWFGNVDVRPLGLFRIGFGALMLKEAIYHIFTAAVWYSDAGMFPVRLLPRVSPNIPTLMSGLTETWMAQAFFVVWALVALLLLLGWRTRVMSVVNLVLLVSVINRNEMVVTGADGVMQVLGFWSLFLPLGRSYSLDARRRSTDLRPVTYAFPVRMFQLQVALIYLFTTIYKLQGETWLNGDAVYMALQVRMHTFPLAEWLLANASLPVLGALTYFTLAVEGGFALLVLAPVFQPYLRRAGLLLGVVLHVGIAVVMNVPNFPLIMMFSYLVFLDSDIVNWIERQFLVNETPAQPDSDLPAEIPKPAPTKRGCSGALAEIPRGMAQGAYRGLVATALVTVMSVVVWGNLLNNDALARQLQLRAMPAALENGLRAIGLWESWAMFAPNPLTFEGWFGLNGIFPNGNIYDLRSGLNRPHWYYGPTARWGKLEENLMSRGIDDPLFTAWTTYTCHEYQATGVVNVQIVLYSRPTSPPGQPFEPYQTKVIQGVDCR